MALSCLIGRVSSPALKVQSLKNFRNLLIKPTTKVDISRQPYHHNLIPNENKINVFYVPKKEFQKTTSFEITVKKFSTSSIRLAEHKNHDHSKIWSLERLLSVLLLPLVPAALLNPCQQLDTALALLVVIHTHFGLEAIVVDYIRPILFGNLAPKIGMAVLYAFSIVTLAGLLNLIYNDIGLANTVLSIWKK